MIGAGDGRRERWQRVEALYVQALECDPAGRPALLDVACAGDAALRTEIESLLACEPDSASFIESPAIELIASDIGEHGDDLAGVRLGAYVIGAWLGSGGMGEVYRARDTQLQRDVALKILPGVLESGASDERVARFRREAQVLASLNHPNVGAIYGFVEGQPGGDASQGVVYALALELVEGPTLAERIARGPIRVPEALPIARQIADGLQAAHLHGVIHRDLKPANIKLRPDGTVKVLDFGLAKAIADAGGGATDPSVASAAGPQASTALGTAAYMCPEQAQGRAVDQRCDVWAFGAVLYEMLAGRRAFERRGIRDTLAAVLHQDVDWSALPSDTPASIRTLLVRCLDRDAVRRPRDLGYVRRALDPEPSAPVSRRMALTVLGAGAVVATAAWYLRTPAPARRSGAVRLPFILPKGSSVLLPASRQALALAPDGSQFVYAANDRVFRRSLSELEAQAVAGTEGFSRAHQPTFSPDGRFVAFWAELDRTIKRIAVEGGTATTIAAADNPFGMSWTRDGFLLVGQGRRGIARVAAGGGELRTLVRVADGEEAHGPQLLPDGAVLFTIATGVDWLRWEEARIVVQEPGARAPTTVVERGSDARYLPTGHLVFVRAMSLMAAGFDVDRRQLTTAPVAVVDRVRRSNNRDTGAAHFSTSDTGRLIYVPGAFAGPERGDVEIVLSDRAGTVERLPLTPGPYRGVRAAPSGRRITFATDATEPNVVYTYEPGAGAGMRALDGPGSNRYPLFARLPSGLRLVFQSDREGDRAIYWQDADGASAAERLTTPGPGESHAPESWAGETLLFSVIKGFDVSLWSLSLRDRTPVRYGDVHSEYPIGARFSPDGKWVAYTSHNEKTGEGTDLFVQAFPATGIAHQLRVERLANAPSSTPHKPVWSHDGRELFYVPRLGGFEVVRVQTTPVFSFGPPVALPRPFSPGAPTFRTLFDLMADGRFVGVVPVGAPEDLATATPGIQVVLDWFDELHEKVPL